MVKRKSYCILTIVITILAVLCLYAFIQMNNYKNHVKAGYRRAFTELTNYVSDIDITLSKAAVTTDTERLSVLADKLWLYSAFAKENLGLLPTQAVQLDNTSDFLSQVGDYTYCMTNKLAAGEMLSDDEYSQLSSLTDYAKSLSSQLLKMEEGVMNGAIPVGTTDGILNRSVSAFGEDLQEIEEKFDDYTSLIYDGPFSQHTETAQGDMQKSPAITKEEAAQKAKAFAGGKDAEFSGESNGALPTYDFTVKMDSKGRTKYIKVTKHGGYISMLVDSRTVDNVVIENSTAEKAAQNFLFDNGYAKMKRTGYVIEGNCAIFAYAYVQNEFVMYPDLIKIKVALDNGEIVGFEADGFIMNHSDSRPMPKLTLSKEDAAAKVNKDFKLTSVNKALIPLDTGKEVYCYEVIGDYKDKTFLIYINTETGREEDVLMLVKTEYGELTA